jgi:hypothetical protein
LQRLYSTFANGWPGVGLLVQRLVAAIMLVRFVVIQLTESSFSASMPHIIGGFAGIFFLFGLWTPVAGTLIAVAELWIAVTDLGDPWISIMLATIGGTSAMLGPGAFSVDARLYGRRHLHV